MSVHKRLVRCNVITVNGIRKWDLPVIQGIDQSLVEDLGNEMIVKLVACDNPSFTDKPLTLAQFNTHVDGLSKLQDVASHPKDTKLVRYGRNFKGTKGVDYDE